MTPRSRRRRAPRARLWLLPAWPLARPAWASSVWPWASRRRRRPRSRAAGRAEGSASSFLLSALALIEVGDPLGDLGVLGCEAAVRLVMLQRAVAIAEVEVAEDGEIPMRV